MNLKYLGAGGALAFASLAILAWLIHVSPWFLWSLVGDHPWQGYLNLNSQTAPSIQSLAAPYQLQRFMPFNPNHVKSFAYARFGSKRILALAPKWKYRADLMHELDQAGLSTQSLGVLIISGSSYSTWELIGKGLRGMLNIVKNNPSEITPIFIANTPFGKVIAQERKTSEAPESGFVVRLPGEFITILPKDIQGQWNQYLSQKISLTSVKANIVQEMGKYSEITIWTSGGDSNDVVLTTVGDPRQWQQIVFGWVRQEQEYRQPVTAAFRLPDGTLGYERRPAENIPGTLFSEAASQPGCVQDQSLGKLLFFCQSGSTSSFGTKLLDTSQVASRGDWEVFLGKGILTAFNIPKIQSVIASPEADYIHIVIHTN